MPFVGSVRDAQTDILRWLKSLGHAVEGLSDSDDDGRFLRRSCEIKRRFAVKPSEPGTQAYRCKFCGQWHLASLR